MKNLHHLHISMTWLLAWGLFVYLRTTTLIQAQENVTTGTPLDYNSCQDRCEEYFFPGHPCYCDYKCQQFENCCDDYFVACKAEYVWSDEWSEFEGHAYKFFSDIQGTMSVGVEACRGHGGLLASINSAAEGNFIQDSVLRRRTLSAFIGGSDATTEGKWMWVDGTVMNGPTDSWNFWLSGQPDNADNNEDCAVISNYMFWVTRQTTLPEYVWIDHNCATNNREIQGYICERTLACEPNPCQNGGTCYYVGAAEDFRCECMPAFYGLECEVELTDGETWTECGETELTASSGLISSPQHPRDYPPNVICQWEINVGEGKTISLSIEMLDLESTKHCFFDSLTITDGDSDSGTNLIGPVCGDMSASNSTSLMQQLATSGPKALISFKTDSSKSGKGFRLTYKADKCGRGVGDSGCGVHRTFETDCGHAEFTQGPAEGATCQWDIQVQAGHFINLTFTKFNIQDTGKGCTSGAMVIYDGSVAPNSVLGRGCGHRFPWSVLSTSNHLYLRLQGVSWSQDLHAVAFQYTSMEASLRQVMTQRVVVNVEKKGVGRLNAATTPFNVESGEMRLHTWSVRCRLGDRLHLNWTLFSSSGAHLQIYDGHSIYSRLVASEKSESQTLVGKVTATTFQLLVMVTSNRSERNFQFEAIYRAVDWAPLLSGCYRPLYSLSTDSVSTENNIVLPDQPVVVMVSESANHASDPGYDPGLYCKWTIIGESGTRLQLRLLNFNVPPNDPDCSSDGLVVYDPATNVYKATLCGASPDLLEKTIVSASNILELYFYSDTRGGRRENAILRAILTSSESTLCEFHQMETSSNPTLDTSCGLLLSPWFPGMVPPGLWAWTLQGHESDYFVANVHYVRGPALIVRECKQYFQLVEIPLDSTILRQREASLMKLCEDTDLFIPEYNIKNPPWQKLMIELNTIKSSVYQIWEFKISYSTRRMQKPMYTEAPPGACPTGYNYYRGDCYLYEQWVFRHYDPVKYKYMTTWQGSYERCRNENATLMTIKDQEEAEFIKYQFSITWYSNQAGTSQINHRMVYLGLTNQDKDYFWNDGVRMAYSDWFQPLDQWEQPILHDDEQEKYDLLGLTLTEPKPDLGSVCTALLLRSPFGSLNWVKLPCDYPIFRAGLICKKPASTRNDMVESYDISLRSHQAAGYKGCRQGWRLIGDLCFRLLTDYSKVITITNTDMTPSGITYSQAEAMCAQDNGRLSAVDTSTMETIKIYLKIWRHGLNMGNIWLSSDRNLCKAIEVYKTHRLSKEVKYRIIEGTCAKIFNDLHPFNVFCFTNSIVQREVCSEEEFQCENGVCISTDYVCDGTNDCFDNSDEAVCPDMDSCGMDRFQCDNGRCISMSLFCDMVDNCEDGSDEATCVKEKCQQRQFRCHSGECLHQGSVCDFRRDCKDGSDEDTDTCESRCRGFRCFSGLCLPSSMQHDIIRDCPGVAQEDEIDKERNILIMRDLEYDAVANVDIKNKSYLGCSKPEEAQCVSGYDRCYSRADTCVFDTRLVDEGQDTSVQASCRDGSHLRTSCGEIECPGMFHCPSSYCVHYSKVCDGWSDCPRGEDETRCDGYICPGLFHCKGESFCVPHDKVCDGEIHCTKYREDEKYCRTSDIICQDTCNCEGNVAFCTNASSTLPTPEQQSTRGLRSIIISNSRLNIMNNTFSGLHWLGKLDMSSSGITELPANVFQDLTNLIELDLSGNEIKYLDPAVFNGLVSLKVLNLHNNKLDFVDKDTFGHLSSLHYIIITMNPLTDVTQDAFSKVPTLKILNSDAFKFCCIAKQVEVCTPEPDEFSSCEDLMANYPLQVSIWVLGMFAFVGNIFVVIWRIKTDRSKVSSFLIISLGCSDFFMGVYMLIIASADNYYRGQYIIYAEKWRASSLCQIAGILATFSSEVSVFMLTVITADRLYVILFPLKEKIRLSQARNVVIGGWAVCFVISVMPALGIPYFGDAFFGRSGVCLPFQMNNKQLPGWEYSVAIFLVVNLISFLFIFVAYILIFAKVKAAAKKMGDKATTTTDDISLAKKLMLIVATDLLCWVPIILIGFMGLGGTPIPGQVSSWVAVFVLPLNSAVNPILYTMSTIDCSRRQKRKRPAIPASSTMATGVSETTVVGSTMQMKRNGNSA